MQLTVDLGYEQILAMLKQLPLPMQQQIALELPQQKVKKQPKAAETQSKRESGEWLNDELTEDEVAALPDIKQIVYRAAHRPKDEVEARRKRALESAMTAITDKDIDEMENEMTYFRKNLNERFGKIG